VGHAHARVALGQRVEQLGRVVGRGVVDRHELDVGEARAEDRLGALLEMGLLAMDGQDEAQARHV
jgi:hypothetical protein